MSSKVRKRQTLQTQNKTTKLPTLISQQIEPVTESVRTKSKFAFPIISEMDN